MEIVTPDDDIMLITSEGIIIRMDSEDISTYGRVTKGVRLMRFADGVSIISIAKVVKDSEDDSETAENTDTQEESDVQTTENAEE